MHTREMDIVLWKKQMRGGKLTRLERKQVKVADRRLLTEFVLHMVIAGAVLGGAMYGWWPR